MTLAFQTRSTKYKSTIFERIPCTLILFTKYVDFTVLKFVMTVICKSLGTNKNNSKLYASIIINLFINRWVKLSLKLKVDLINSLPVEFDWVLI